MNSVVISGAAIQSPVGNSLEEVFEAIKSGVKGIGRIKNFDSSPLPSPLGAEVKVGGEVEKISSKVDRKDLFLKRAMESLHLDCDWLSGIFPEKKSLILGAGLDYFDLSSFAEERMPGDLPWQNFTITTIEEVRDLALRYEYRGNVAINVSACVASGQAIGLSYNHIASSEQGTAAVTGGFDSMINPLHFIGFFKLGALSKWSGDAGESCRPFDVQRQGLVLGEGAALYLLQKLEDAPPDKILAEIKGYASTMDAYMVTDPDPEGRGLAECAIRAIAKAGIEPDDIDCVHLHGTGTQKNEIAETKAMSRIFGSRFKNVPVYSMKGQVGHLIGACSSMEMAAVLYSLLTQSVPPTVNYHDADPEVPLMVVKNKPLEMKIEHVLKVNAAFGGQNTALVVKRHAS